MKRALLSVSDKDGILEFAKGLSDLGIELLSTGGTAKLLREGGLEVKDVSEVTGFPECLDGRVKTLHPKVHGGILSKRGNAEHEKTLRELEIEPIDLLVINLYPFKETIMKEGVTFEEAIENIDIGGPTMLRSAAKNFRDVTVVTDRKDYGRVLNEIKHEGNTTYETRYDLALKVFEETAFYDGLIAKYLRKTEMKEPLFPEKISLPYEKVMDLRYGENPHQKAAFYRESEKISGSLVEAEQIQGKELSFNNLNDANGALELLKEFEEPTAVAVKHTNPCGVASDETVYKAFEKCYAADPKSIFGGIVALNREVDEKTAREMDGIFLEVIIAPAYTEEALDIFGKKKNLRVLRIPSILEQDPSFEVKKVAGGLLLQEKNKSLISEIKVVTEREPSSEEMRDLEFAYKVAKHVKSNGIVVAKNRQTLAVGPGQTSRIWAVENGLRNTIHDCNGSVMASDAFFPFDDCVTKAQEYGVASIIQPGGSMNDQESIDTCNRFGISMIFTGKRHFKH